MEWRILCLNAFDWYHRVKNETTKISREKRFGHDWHVERNNPSVHYIWISRYQISWNLEISRISRPINTTPHNYFVQHSNYLRTQTLIVQSIYVIWLSSANNQINISSKVEINVCHVFIDVNIIRARYNLRYMSMCIEEKYFPTSLYLCNNTNTYRRYILNSSISFLADDMLKYLPNSTRRRPWFILHRVSLPSPRPRNVHGRLNDYLTPCTFTMWQRMVYFRVKTVWQIGQIVSPLCILRWWARESPRL